MDLLDTEIRALGCLIEKQRTTPDAYPLTLNSLRLACNQATNREPVVAYQESDLRDALHRLERRGFVRFAGGAGSRVAKYRHLLAERLPMDGAEQALICVLMLRGPQTPGELKQRAERMHAFASLAEVHDALERLIDRKLVARLPRRPGQKEERYGQLLGGEAEEDGDATAAHAGRAVAHVVHTGSDPLPSHGSAAASPPGETRPVHLPQAAAPVSSTAAPAPPPAEASLRGELERLRERVTIIEQELGDLKADLGVGARQ